MNIGKSFDLFESLCDFSVCINANGIIQQASQQSQAFLQLPTKILQEPVESYIQPEDMVLLEKALENAKAYGGKQTFVCRLLRQRLLPVWVDCYVLEISADEFLLLAFDASHWKDSESRLIYTSTYDVLTGLPGKVLLDDRLSMSIQTAQREKDPLMILVVGLDGIKKIYDILGINTGDQLVRAIAERLQSCVRRSDTIARINNDEFSMILMGVGLDSVELMAKKTMAAVQRPFRIDEHTLHIGASLGISVFPEHGEENCALYKNAEMAMYRAKSLGKNHWKIYSDQINETERSDLSLESAMYEGIENGEFSLHYQPIFCAQSGVLKGAEALMRWNNSRLGFISPMRFIPLAEASGLIKILGAWALRSACHQAVQWQQAGFNDFYISVNVSPRQFVQEDFLEMIHSALNETGLLPEHLMLEITEGVLMDSPQRSGEILMQLHDAGVKIGIDDFGTGYSSLAYLKKFPLSVLKIDKSFINDVISSAEDMAIVDAIISLTEGLNLMVVAEGVENDEQLAFLKKKGCDLVQGYLLGKPVTPDDFKEKHMLCLR